MTEINHIKLDTSAVRAYAQYLRQAPEIATEEMKAGIDEALLLLEREIKEATPVGAHALLRGSVAHEMINRIRGEEVSGKVFSPLNYALPVELGTKPHFPPIEPLRDWVEKRLGVPAGASKSVAFLIARKIAAKGTKGAKMFTDTLDKRTDKVREIIALRVQRIAARLTGGER